MTNFSAGPQTIGFLHQVRMGLLLLLDHEEYELRLEHLDDVDLSRDAEPTELLQLKHRAPNTKLTDTSTDLWKTLRVWSEHVQKDPSALDDTLFSLVTTATAPEGAAATYLRADAGRDPAAALKLLNAAKEKSENKNLKKSFDAVFALSADRRVALLDRVYVIDQGPDIEEARARLEQHFKFSVRREHRVPLADRVEGWWFRRCVEHLRGHIATLSGYEATDKIVELAQQFRQDSLPIDLLGLGPSASEEEALSGNVFVVQLRSVSVGTGRIRNAIIDYYRAFAQRSRWARDQLLVDGETERYEERLRDEWERMRLALEDEVDDEAAEEELQRLGRKLLTWMETQANIRIRDKVTEPYVMRGSFHMLADENPPRVWWHPEFNQRVASLLLGADE